MMICKRTLCLCLWAWVLLPPVALAGDTLLGAPSYDHATVTTYRAVTWDDFQGKGTAPPGWSRWSTGSFAHIATAIRMRKYESVERLEGDGWVAKAVGARPYAIMNKDFSAVKHGARNAYTLDHEQLHFDITETVARRLAVELAAIEGRGTTREEARQDLVRRVGERFDTGLDEMAELQSRYDGETGHGTRKKKQKKWAQMVQDMFLEATEALVAVMEAE